MDEGYYIFDPATGEFWTGEGNWSENFKEAACYQKFRQAQIVMGAIGLSHIQLFRADMYGTLSDLEDYD